MSRVITITGASGCGKSTAISYFLRANGRGYCPELLKKYKTREKRQVEGSNEDGMFVSEIPPECDLVYEQYGDRYGIQMSTIFDKLSKGITPIVIVNDVRVVQDIKTALGPCVSSIYLFRIPPSLGDYRKLAEERNVTAETDALNRFNKANAVFRIYIENIFLFDHVILNSWGLEELEKQVKNLVTGFCKELHWPLIGTSQ